jgi:hypothetical protein
VAAYVNEYEVRVFVIATREEHSEYRYKLTCRRCHPSRLAERDEAHIGTYRLNHQYGQALLLEMVTKKFRDREDEL